METSPAELLETLELLVSLLVVRDVLLAPVVLAPESLPLSLVVLS